MGAHTLNSSWPNHMDARVVVADGRPRSTSSGLAPADDPSLGLAPGAFCSLVPTLAAARPPGAFLLLKSVARKSEGGNQNEGEGQQHAISVHPEPYKCCSCGSERTNAPPPYREHKPAAIRTTDEGTG